MYPLKSDLKLKLKLLDVGSFRSHISETVRAVTNQLEYVRLEFF